MTTANLTIQDNDTVVQYTSTGGTVFAGTFPILDEDEVKVSVDQVLQTLGVDYTISGVGDENGFTVTFLSATTALEIITIWQELPFERLTGFATGAAVLTGQALNTEFARQIRQDQELRRDIRRALHLPIDDYASGQIMELPTLTERQGMFLAFDLVTGAAVASAGTGADSGLREDLAAGASTLVDSDAIGYALSVAETAVGAVVLSGNYYYGNPFRYMSTAQINNVALGIGTIDVTAALQTAVNVLLEGGPDVEPPPGSYLLNGVTGDTRKNGILFPWDSNFTNRPYVRLRGQGGVTFKAGSNDMVLVRVSRPFVEVSGIKFEKNTHTNVTGIGVIPESTTQTTTQVSQSYFLSDNCSGDVAIGYQFQPGPQVGGSDSGCFYHTIRNPNFNDALRGFDFQKNVDYGSHPNHTTRVVLDHPSVINANNAIYADALGDIDIIAPGFELVTAAGALATPTAIYVTANGFAAKDIRIHGGYIEACTRDIYTDSTRAMITFGTVYSDAKVAGAGAYNIIRVDRDKRQLSYDAAGAAIQETVSSAGGLDMMGDPGNTLAASLHRRGLDGTYVEALTPYHKASNTTIGTSGSYHERTNTSASNPINRDWHTHATTPLGNRITFSGGSPNNTTQWFFFCDDTTNSKAIIYSNGDFQSRTNSYGAISDAKLKNIIGAAPSYWKDFKAYEFVKFTFKDEDKPMLGLVAQQVETISPGLVSVSPDMVNDVEGNLVPTGEVTKAVKYSIITLQAECVLQEAQRRIEVLEKQIAALAKQLKTGKS